MAHEAFTSAILELVVGRKDRQDEVVDPMLVAFSDESDKRASAAGGLEPTAVTAEAVPEEASANDVALQAVTVMEFRARVRTLVVPPVLNNAIPALDAAP
jgi:hypothetical protein